MIEIKEKNNEIAADDGINIYHFPTWDELWKNIDIIKRNPEEKVFIRIGSRMERVRT